MRPRWFIGMDEKLQKELKASYLDGTLMRERLIQMLNEDIDKELKQMRQAAKDQVANLSEYYADSLARQATLENIIKLLEESV